MTPAEIRLFVARSTPGIDKNESGTCQDGTSATLLILGEIAAQFAEFNQSFSDLKRQISGGHLGVDTVCGIDMSAAIKNPASASSRIHKKIVAIKVRGSRRA